MWHLILTEFSLVATLEFYRLQYIENLLCRAKYIEEYYILEVVRTVGVSGNGSGETNADLKYNGPGECSQYLYRILYTKYNIIKYITKTLFFNL